jgi:hypothetical protein
MVSPLPESLVRFIRSCVPTYQAAEVLLFLAANPEREWTPEELVVAMRPVVVTVPAMKEYLSLFVARRVIRVTELRVMRIVYEPSTSELEDGVAALTHAYNERPVTLIATIYRIAEMTIQAFADSFKLKSD